MANDTATKIDRFLQNVVYSVANIWGLGNSADQLMNAIKGSGWFGSSGNGKVTLDAAQLISYIKNKLGLKGQELNKLISIIDSQLSVLPPALSQTIKHGLQEQRRKLITERKSLASDLYKVENAVNQATSLASRQDYLASGQKEQNQDVIKDIVESTERSLS